MKRFLAVILMLTVMLSASACIQLKPEYRDPFVTTQATEAGTTASPDETGDLPTIATPPVWSTADVTAGQFLSHAGVVDCSKREYSYNEMVQDLELLSKAYPQLFSYRSFGTTVAGREMYVAVLGNPNAEKQILVSAGIHGREYLTPLLVMKQMEFYLAYYTSGTCNGFTYKQLFDDVCFYVVPMTNPDGIMLSQAGISTVSDPALYSAINSTYHKDYQNEYTQQTNINEYLKIWKANANGVDLNRNFDALWKEYNGIKRPSHKNFKGTSAASEPETQAMVALTESLSNIQAVLCIHSQGEVLYWNCGQETTLAQKTLAFTNAISDLNGYHVVEEQNNDASYSDWCALKKGLIAVTVETGVDACPLPISQFPTIWEQNWELFAMSAVYFQ